MFFCFSFHSINKEPVNEDNQGQIYYRSWVAQDPPKQFSFRFFLNVKQWSMLKQIFMLLFHTTRMFLQWSTFKQYLYRLVVFDAGSNLFSNNFCSSFLLLTISLFFVFFSNFKLFTSLCFLFNSVFFFSILEFIILNNIHPSLTFTSDLTFFHFCNIVINSPSVFK